MFAILCQRFNSSCRTSGEEQGKEVPEPTCLLLALVDIPGAEVSLRSQRLFLRRRFGPENHRRSRLHQRTQGRHRLREERKISERSVEGKGLRHVTRHRYRNQMFRRYLVTRYCHQRRQMLF